MQPIGDVGVNNHFVFNNNSNITPLQGFIWLVDCYFYRWVAPVARIGHPFGVVVMIYHIRQDACPIRLLPCISNEKTSAPTPFMLIMHDIKSQIHE